VRHTHARRQNRRSNKDLRTETRVVFATVKQQEALAYAPVQEDKGLGVFAWVASAMTPDPFSSLVVMNSCGNDCSMSASKPNQCPL
jgi:hypothetical protein